MKLSSLGISMGLSVLIASCGHREPSSLSTNTMPAPHTKPLIIGMAGFNTCKESDSHGGQSGPLGGRLSQHLIDLQRFVQEKTGFQADVFASCFDSDRQLITSASTDNWQVAKPKDEDYITDLHSRMDGYSDIYVVGHSYGGWLSMKLVESWQGSPEIIKTLYTIDPISKKLCFFDTPGDCVSAPKDIAAPSRQHIKDQTGVWVNAWQQQTIFLHSSAIAQADENQKFNLSHWDIDDHAPIWDGLKANLGL